MDEYGILYYENEEIYKGEFKNGMEEGYRIYLLMIF